MAHCQAAKILSSSRNNSVPDASSMSVVGPRPTCLSGRRMSDLSGIAAPFRLRQRNIFQFEPSSRRRATRPLVTFRVDGSCGWPCGGARLARGRSRP